jgi:CBS domain-containing protein
MAQAIRDVMTPDPASVSPEDTAVEAARKMREADAGAILVCDGDQLRGLVTDRDIVVRAVADGRDPSEVKVQEIASSEVHALSPDEPVERAIELMRERHVRRVPVVEQDRPVGIVSIGDLALERDRSSALADISAAPGNQ